ncbi:MAG: transposase [bacterium]|jgi:hypothetical protein|nr:transposase [candidate division KSB1 bacterium]MDH7561529.1 transposase [bacterium]
MFRARNPQRDAFSAVRRVRADLSWKVALDIAPEEIPFTAKSTLVVFRAKLLSSQKERALFERIVGKIEAAMPGRPRGRRWGKRIALDTTPVFGRGAVKDVFNLLADLIRTVLILLTQAKGSQPAAWARKHQFGRYFGKSFKGMCRINWDDPTERDTLLAQVVADARRVRHLAHEAMATGQVKRLPERLQQQLREKLSLVDEIITQNVEDKRDGTATMKQGVARGRIVLTTDPEMRHGRKSESVRFDGYKSGVAADTDTAVIAAVAVAPANRHDGSFSQTLVEQTERAIGEKVEEIIADSTFGDEASRAHWAERGVKVTAKVPGSAQKGDFAKEAFATDPDKQWARCPAGHTTHTWSVQKVKIGGKEFEGRRFVFPARGCRKCPFYRQCVSSRRSNGRSITVHPFEDYLAAARQEQATESFRDRYRKRVVVEHRIARLAQLGMRKARYFGRDKVLLQAILTAMVANLSLFWGYVRSQEGTSPFVSWLLRRVCA